MYDDTVAGKGKKWTINHTLSHITLSVPMGCKCLEVGCGTGLYTRALQSRGFSVTAGDVSFPMLSKARETDRTGTYVRMDGVMGIPFHNDCFDAVLAFDVLAYLSDLSRFFLEVKRILRPTGHFVAVVPNNSSIVRKLVRCLGLGSYARTVSRELSSFDQVKLANLLSRFFGYTETKVIRPVPGSWGKLFEAIPFIVGRILYADWLGLGIIGWGQKV